MLQKCLISPNYSQERWTVHVSNAQVCSGRVSTIRFNDLETCFHEDSLSWLNLRLGWQSCSPIKRWQSEIISAQKHFPASHLGSLSQEAFPESEETSPQLIKSHSETKLWRKLMCGLNVLFGFFFKDLNGKKKRIGCKKLRERDHWVFPLRSSDITKDQTL